MSKIINLINKNKIFLLIDIIFLLIIAITINYVIDFQYGKYFLAGDFRFNIYYKELQGDYILHMISQKYSMNNFIHLPFYSVYLFLQYIPYKYILIYIFFIIPILIYLSTKYILLKTTHIKGKIVYNILFSSLAFYVAINPPLFIRYIHWTILHGIIFFPIFLYVQYKFLMDKKVINKFLFILPLLIYFGAMTPQLVVVYIIASIFMFTSLLFFLKTNLLQYTLKGGMLFISGIFSFLHVIYPSLLGYIQAKSDYEGVTEGWILAYFAKNSNLYSAISGTNFFEPLLEYPLIISTGFVIFILCLFLLVIIKKSNIVNLILLLSSIILLIIVSGYPVFSFIFDLLSKTYISHLLWLAKDPNMYYLFFIILVVLLLVRLIVFSSIKKKYIFIFSFLIVISNMVFILGSDKKIFNEYYPFIDIPKEYFSLAVLLENDNGRNYWLPSDTYIGKTFSKKMIIFPSPSWWATKNKELVYYSTPTYQNLMKTIDYEIYDNNCKAIYFLDWIVAAQNLNLIIDHNSVNTTEINAPDTKSRMRKAEACIRKLPNIYKYMSVGRIDIYKSKLKLGKNIYEYEGNIDRLNKFLKKNPSNIIYKFSYQEKIRKLDISAYSILNESFDKNWLDEDNKSTLYKVNLASMLFEGTNQKFHYRGESEFEKVVNFQKFMLVFFVILAILYLCRTKNRNHT